MHSDAQLESDTIVAIATPPGRGGIAVVRLSGPAALAIGRQLVTLRREPVSHHAHYGVVVDEDGTQIDDAVLTWSAAPHSYTTEDVVEISTHGSPVVQQAVVALALRHGARLARPGEFTERAFLRGRLDLSAAEAVRDLIDAQTLGQARLAAEQLGGSLTREVLPIKQTLIHLIAELEAGIDFAEDDLHVLSHRDAAERIIPLLHSVQQLESSFGRSRLLREGMKLAIVGRPNSGKSSLFNRLLGKDRSIVTPVAGTTRDTVSEALVIAGVPVHLVDTAGIRPTNDEVERLGVQRTWEIAAEADLILHVVDSTDQSQTDSTEQLVFLNCPVLTVFNKADLLRPDQRGRLDQRATQGEPNRTANASTTRSGSPHAVPRQSTALPASALTGEGIQQIEAELSKLVAGGNAVTASATLTNTRQHSAAQVAVQALTAALTAAQNGIAHEAILVDLYAALEALDALTGQTLSSQILDTIFSTFCIGK